MCLPFMMKTENSLQGAGDATELFHHAQRATSYKAKVHTERAHHSTERILKEIG